MSKKHNADGRDYFARRLAENTRGTQESEIPRAPKGDQV